MGIISDIFSLMRFKDTIFYKENSDLQDRLDALVKLNNDYPNNKNITNELYMVKKGLDGEKEISYQLKKSNIGLYVLHDIKIKYQDLTAQIDYIVITPIFTYFIECKNLIGNITVNEKGDFIREYTYNGKKIRKGMYSPLRQVEAQKEVLRKIWNEKASKFNKLFSAKYFDYYNRVLVVASNNETILNTLKAPKDIKYKIIKSDSLVRKLEYDIAHRSSEDIFDNQKEMEKRANYYLSLSVNESINYYEFYKNKFCINNNINKEEIKNKLLNLRKRKSLEMNVPAYYIFNNEELEKILETLPRTTKELKDLNILALVKIKLHGNEIIDIINERR